MTPEQMWERFVELLRHEQPLRDPRKMKPDEIMPYHTNFLGSVASYKEVFLKASKEQP
jgi:hypothetical protein